MVKKLVQAWHPDFIKLTASEGKSLNAAKDGEYFDADNIDFDSLDS